MLLGHVSVYIVNQMLKSSSGASGCRWGRKASNTLVRYLGAARDQIVADSNVTCCHAFWTCVRRKIDIYDSPCQLLLYLITSFGEECQAEIRGWGRLPIQSVKGATVGRELMSWALKH